MTNEEKPMDGWRLITLHDNELRTGERGLPGTCPCGLPRDHTVEQYAELVRRREATEALERQDAMAARFVGLGGAAGGGKTAMGMDFARGDHADAYGLFQVMSSTEVEQERSGFNWGGVRWGLALAVVLGLILVGTMAVW